MFLCNISTNSWTSGTAISLSQPTISTNSNVSLNSSGNGLIISNPGWYKVRLQSIVAATGTDLGAVIYANGTAISASECNVTTVAAADTLIETEYPIHVVATDTSAQATITIVPTGAGTPVNGYVSVTKIS